MLQAFFDDSGNDPSSQFFVLAGYVAPLNTWAEFTASWDKIRCKTPSLEYFKMSEAMALRGKFEGWDHRERSTRVNEFSSVLARANLVRLEVFLERQHFDDFVKGTNFDRIFDDPYFICFYHLCMSLAAAEVLNWTPDSKIIFDAHGKIGARSAFWWNWAKTHMPAAWSSKLGECPTFASDIETKPLQAADMAAWLIRDALIRGANIPSNDAAAVPFKNMLRHSAISKHVTRDELMDLGAQMLIAKEKMIREFGTDDFVFEQSSGNFVRRRNSKRR